MTDHHDRLERMERKIDDIARDVTEVRERTARLEVKSGIFGALGGFLSSAALYFGLKR